MYVPYKFVVVRRIYATYTIYLEMVRFPAMVFKCVGIPKPKNQSVLVVIVTGWESIAIYMYIPHIFPIHICNCRELYKVIYATYDLLPEPKTSSIEGTFASKDLQIHCSPKQHKY